MVSTEKRVMLLYSTERYSTFLPVTPSLSTRISRMVGEEDAVAYQLEGGVQLLVLSQQSRELFLCRRHIDCVRISEHRHKRPSAAAS